jgi:hypothetical protein
MVAEKQAVDEDYDPDEDDDAEEFNNNGDGSCMCSKLSKDFPDWKWFITRKGLHMVEHLKEEALNRDQDEMGRYHYNDFSAHGFQEVVENHVSGPKGPAGFTGLWLANPRY